jgi:hypothetical protein
MGCEGVPSGDDSGDIRGVVGGVINPVLFVDGDALDKDTDAMTCERRTPLQRLYNASPTYKSYRTTLRNTDSFSLICRTGSPEIFAQARLE